MSQEILRRLQQLQNMGSLASDSLIGHSNVWGIGNGPSILNKHKKSKLPFNFLLLRICDPGFAVCSLVELNLELTLYHLRHVLSKMLGFLKKYLTNLIFNLYHNLLPHPFYLAKWYFYSIPENSLITCDSQIALLKNCLTLASMFNFSTEVTV